jgi:hypothetical protein
MGFRYRSSIRLGRGLRIDLSKGGASLSVSRRGATVNLGKRGIRGTVGLPGSGCRAGPEPVRTTERPNWPRLVRNPVFLRPRRG